MNLAGPADILLTLQIIRCHLEFPILSFVSILHSLLIPPNWVTVTSPNLSFVSGFLQHIQLFEADGK